VSSDPPAPSEEESSRFVTGAILALILVASFLIKLNHLGHASIKALDESFHALVAKNLMRHPLTPTLIDRPWLAYDYRDWQNNHVWLHKPVVPLWQMAASMKLFGATPLALRLPSAILTTAAVWLTYAIGVRLLSRRAALIGAGVQAFIPTITTLVQGYVFSDHIDAALLFWVELSVYFLVRAIQDASTRWAILAGAAQGIAYLCKTYPAFIVTGIALVAWLLPLCGLARREPRDSAEQGGSTPNGSTLTPTLSLPGRGSRKRFGGRHVLALVVATIVAVAPWTIWCAVRFPREFAWEQLQVFRHLGTNVEGWAAPWDRLVFDYSLRIYHVFYPMLLAAIVILVPRAWRERNLNLWLVLAWLLGVLVPFTIATSKTPTATLIGWPAGFLVLGELVARATRGDRWCLGAWLGASLVGIAWRGKFALTGWGYPDPPRFAGVMLENVWVVWHLLIALGVAAVVAVAVRRSNRGGAAVAAMVVAATLASAWLSVRTVRTTYAVTNNPSRDRPDFAQLGAAVRNNLPADAVLLFEIREKCEHVMLMFHADRTAYAVDATDWLEVAAKVSAAGGWPVLVTPRPMPLPPVFDRPIDGLRVYALPNAPPNAPSRG
jgi:4-amino-4-deoxy-L-arabinose transferase